MIKIIKKSLITFHGVDCLELLLVDDFSEDYSPCSTCVYCDWTSAENEFTCEDVHNCLEGSYFQILPL